MRARNAWIGLAVILALVAGLLFLELESSDSLLDKIARVQPGVNLNPIKSQLGQQMCEYDDLDTMRHLGSIKDTSFYQGKRLYMFVGAKWPWRALEVYTDKNDTVVFLTWQWL